MLPRGEADELVDKAHGAVSRYGYGLSDIAGTTLQMHQKENLARALKKEFYSNEISVPNDIDPKNNTGDRMALEDYLYTLTTQYSKHGLTIGTTIQREDSRTLFISPDEEFLFVKVVVKRSLRGEHNYNGELKRDLLLDIYVWFTLNNGEVNSKAYIYSIVPHEDNAHSFQRVWIEGEMRPLSVQSQAPQPTVSAPQSNAVISPPANVPRQNPTVEASSDCNTPDSDPYLIQGESAWEDFYHADEQFKDLVLRRGMTAVAELTFTVTSKGSLGNGVNVKVHTRNPEIIGEVEEMAIRLLRSFSMSSDAWMPAQKECRQLDALTKLELRLNANKNSSSSTPATAKKPKVSGPCTEPESRPYFISPTESEQKWRQFYLQDEVYLKAVKQQTAGLVEVTFTVKADGSIDSEGISAVLIGGSSNEEHRKQLNYLAKTIVTQSQGWSSGRRACQEVPMSVTMPIRFDPCSSGLQRPRFEGRSAYGRAWKEYVSKNESYVKAVLDGTDGFMDARFRVQKDGNIPLGSLDINFGVSLNHHVTGRAVFEELIEQSSAQGKWSPAYSGCVPFEHAANAQIKFAKSRMDPATVVRVANLSRRQKRKWENKAEWREHKSEKKGGVHFSFGGSGGYFHFPNRSNFSSAAAKNLRWTAGVEAAFGGMFGNVGGMELRYRWLSPRSEASLGVLFNASPKRWPVRFYFPIHFNVSWYPTSYILIGPSIGLLCMDIKMGKYASIYMELIDGTVEFDLAMNVQNNLSRHSFSYTPSIGFRFCRW